MRILARLSDGRAGRNVGGSLSLELRPLNEANSR